MNVICKHRRGVAIPLNERYMNEVDDTNYSFLALNQIYTVHGLNLVSDRLDFLVAGDDMKPDWVPSWLFDVGDKSIPSDWEMRCTCDDINYRHLFDRFRIKYVFGYSLLVNDYQHYEGIIERDPYELLRFATRIVNAEKNDED